MKNVKGLALRSRYPPSRYVFEPFYKFLKKKCKINKYVSKISTGVFSGLLHFTPIYIACYFEASKFSLYSGIILCGSFPVMATIESINRYKKRKRESLEDRI